LSKDEVQAEIGAKVRIVLPSGEEIDTNVIEVLISDSLIGKKNIKGDDTSFVVIEDVLVNIDTEMDFKLAEFMLAQMRNSKSSGSKA
jgi:hypothetical protein